MQSSWEASVNTVWHGMVFKVPCYAAYVLVSYGCFYTALVGFFFLRLLTLAVVFLLLI